MTKEIYHVNNKYNRKLKKCRINHLYSLLRFNYDILEILVQSLRRLNVNPYILYLSFKSFIF